MKLALSNLAWNNDDSELIFNQLKQLNINNIEGVLTKLDSWDKISLDTLLEFKEKLDSNHILIPSLQSLFYNINCENISDEDIFINHFERIIEYSKFLSVKVLVFGSPSLRKKVDKWEESLCRVFKKLDNILENTGIEISIEPNSKIYGGDYFFTVSEIVSFIEQNNLKNIKTMIDTHNIILEGLNPISELNTYYEHINHIHISENNLHPIKDIDFHLKFSNEVKKIKYNKIITYEVISCNNILESIELFSKIYN
jgi:sugar phosphate isomerase/epimerase